MPRGREINRLIVVPFYELKLLMLCGTSYLKYFVIFPLAVQKGGRPVGDSKVPDACNFLLCCRHVMTFGSVQAKIFPRKRVVLLELTQYRITQLPTPRHFNLALTPWLQFSTLKYPHLQFLLCARAQKTR